MTTTSPNFQSIPFLLVGQDAGLRPGSPTVGPGTEQAAGGNPAGTGGSTTQQTGSPLSPILWILPLLLILLLWSSYRSQKREKRKREELISSLKRNDRVQTIGGIIGTIADIGDREIVLRMDDGQTRIRFARSAIQQVLREGKASRDIEAKPDNAAEKAASN